MLTCSNLTRSFTIGEKRIEVLRDVTLEISEGERVFLTGPSGAGKTTLLYTMAGLERPDSGEIHFCGLPVYSMSRKKQALLRNTRMGYIFQNYHLLPELTAVENVSLPSMISGRRSRSRAAELLEGVGLGRRLDHLPAELSGGEQQRVAIARALINDPDIIFADEPTGNLDSKTGSAIIELLLSVVAESGKSLIVVTHDQGLAELGDRHLVLTDGRLLK